ncbi:MAG: TIGR03032 family protein [Planctomycetaceae bacterium]|nr:TIGR03032 family protein [Planctomycetaceae bacterium]
MTQTNEASASAQITCSASPEFYAWLAQSGGSLVLSTYQAGKVALIGTDDRQVTLLMREFDKPLGMAIQGNRLALATRYWVGIFANAPLLARDYLEDQPGKYDGLFLPRTSYHTGDLHIHDVVFQGDDLLFVNTRFSCLARPSHDHNFEAVWRPKFVSDLVPEDRCHLNGVAMVSGKPKYVTALGTTDSPGAWREKKATGGVVVDVETDEILLDGLAMPHSPRWHNGNLWLLNSGAGELLVMDPASGRRDVVCRLPGYLRGLCFVGPFALVGMCKIREKHLFGGLPIQQRVARLACGVAAVDLRTGGVVAQFEFASGCEELYDVLFLAGIRRGTILNLEKPAVREAVTNPDSSYWLRPSRERPVETPSEASIMRDDAGTGSAPETNQADIDQNGAPRLPSAIQDAGVRSESTSLSDS